MGKVLSISNKGRELTRVSLTKQSLTIGRSPICDVTVRAPGINSVHYLLDWAAEGDFSPEKKDQEWSLIDISKEKITEQSAKKSTTGMGRIISETPTEIDHLTFKIVDDRLHQTVLEGGALHNALLRVKENPMALKESTGQGFVLELVKVQADSGAVTEVAHIDKSEKVPVFYPVMALPSLELSWSNEELINFRFAGDVNKIVVTQWKGISLETLESKAQFQLQRSSFIQIDHDGAEYYFRIVPKIKVPAVPAAWRKDKFLWLFLMLMFVGFGFMAIIKGLPHVEEKKDIVPPRIAEIKVPDEQKPPPPPPPPPPPKPAPPAEKTPPPTPAKPPPPKPSEKEPRKSVKPDDKPATKMAGAKSSKPPAPPSSSDRKAPKKDKFINNDAAEKPVGAVGVLGALSKKGKPDEVTADMMINDGLVSKTVGAEDASIVVKNPPHGVLSTRARNNGGGGGGTSDEGLTAAAGHVGGGDTIKSGAIGGMTGGSGRGGVDISWGDAAGSGSGSGTPDGSGDGDGESVEGGLDKESIRRTLAQYRRDIRTCYERALTVQKRIQGRIVYKWLISPNGPTVWVNLVRSEVGSPKLESCVKDVIQRIQWPKAPNHRETTVNYPFQFQSKD